MKQRDKVGSKAWFNTQYKTVEMFFNHKIQSTNKTDNKLNTSLVKTDSEVHF